MSACVCQDYYAGLQGGLITRNVFKKTTKQGEGMHYDNYMKVNYIGWKNKYFLLINKATISFSLNAIFTTCYQLSYFKTWLQLLYPFWEMCHEKRANFRVEEEYEITLLKSVFKKSIREIKSVMESASVKKTHLSKNKKKQ